MLSICVGFALNISADEKKKQYGILPAKQVKQRKNVPAKK